MIHGLFIQFMKMTERYPKLYKLFKYIVSGGSAAIVDIAFLFIFTDLFKIWYVLSAILAFMLAFFVSFLLQKFWTFQDKGKDNIHIQGIIYLIISIFNLGLNTLLVYIFTDYVGFHYVFSQFVTGIILAFSSYFIYKRFVFKSNETPNNHSESK